MDKTNKTAMDHLPTFAEIPRDCILRKRMQYATVNEKKIKRGKKSWREPDLFDKCSQCWLALTTFFSGHLSLPTSKMVIN